MVMKFVTRGMSYTIRSIRPESGRIGHWMANRNFSISPRKKIGMLIPISDAIDAGRIGPGAVALGGVHAQRDADPDREGHGRQRELDGGREPLQEVVGDIPVGDEAVAQVEAEDAA